jgi:hypothetical protein
MSNETVFAYFGPIENKHVNHILDVSSVPARAIPTSSRTGGKHHRCHYGQA